MSHSKSFTRVYECESFISADKGKKILSDKEVEDLLLCAQEARVRAYTPYSKFRVGAALLTEDGSLVPGCNVENISFGLTICAERNAIARAVGEGHRTFKAIGVVADMKDKFVTPCGACRQVIVEFSVDCEVYLGRPDGAYVKTTIDKLLPDAFTPHVVSLENLTK